MKIGAAWLKEKDGKKFFSCVIEYPDMKLNFAIFKNEEKKAGSKEPDYNIVWTPPKSGSGQSTNSTGAGSFDDQNECPF